MSFSAALPISTTHASFTNAVCDVPQTANNFTYGGSAATMFHRNFLSVPSEDQEGRSCRQLSFLRKSHCVGSDTLCQFKAQARPTLPRRDTTIHVTGRPREPLSMQPMSPLTEKLCKVRDPVYHHMYHHPYNYVTQNSVYGESALELPKSARRMNFVSRCTGNEPCSSVARQQGGIHFLRAIAGENRQSEMKCGFLNPKLPAEPRSMPKRPSKDRAFIATKHVVFGLSNGDS